MAGRIMLICLTVLLLGCGTPRVTVQPLAPLSGRAPTTHVDVYAHPDSLTRPHRELAVLSATAQEPVYTVRKDHPKLLAALMDKAKAIGADALVIFASGDPTLLAGGDRPQGAARTDRASGGSQDNVYQVPTAPWTIRARAVAYE